MKHPHSSKSSKQGSILLTAVIFLFIGFSVAAITLRDALHNSRMVENQVNIERAHYFAETGAEQAADRISKFIGYIPEITSYGHNYGAGRWDYEIIKTGWRTYRVEAIGSVNGVSRQLNIDRVRYPTFAQYGMWTADFRDLWLIPGQLQEGQYHSDSRMNIWSSPSAGGPVFTGKVTTGHHKFGGWPAYATFEQGYEFNSFQGTMATIDFSEMEGEAQKHGMVLKGETSIYFDLDPASGEGQVYLKNRDKYGDNGWHAENLEGLEIVYVKDKIDDEGDVSSSGKIQLYGGTVDGSLTFYADDDIWLKDHMYYKNDPSDDNDVIRDYPEDSDDKVGFISKDDIWVSTSAPDDLTMFGAFIAAGPGVSGNKGNMGVSNYNSYLLGARGYFTTYGSRVMEQVYPGGTFNSRTGLQQTGYASKNLFDERFIDDPPPFYPPISEKLVFEEWHYSVVGFTGVEGNPPPESD